jgi:beta-mannosidase
VVNSPSGGDLPFHSDTGVTHYYGVGAYLRPFDDARRANVRFASECLALANVPCARTVEELHVSSNIDPRWKQAVPRDPGAGWDFEDVRDHYLASLFRVEPMRLRYSDFARYLELSRAVSCLLMEEVFGEWRRSGSTCAGGLVWQWQDVSPGAGWGVLDSLGRCKPVWYALQRAFRSRQIILTDEGLNGLKLHVLNEADSELRATLRLICVKDGSTRVREAELPITVEPRGNWSIGSAALLPGFFDITYAYRFGPRPHDVTFATLHDAASGELIAESCHFPDIAALQPHDLGLEVAVEQDANGWSLRLRSQGFAQFLHIEDTAFTPQENWLHLMPGSERRIALLPDDAMPGGTLPEGEITALNMDRVVRYAGRA